MVVVGEIDRGWLLREAQIAQPTRHQMLQAKVRATGEIDQVTGRLLRYRSTC